MRLYSHYCGRLIQILMMLEWKAIYSVGHDRIDEQHKQLFDIGNRFSEAYEKRMGRDTLESIFGELINYTRFHFDEEERIMRAANYPGFDEHKANHQKLVDLVGWYADTLKRGEQDIEMCAMEFIKTWLNGHILGMDNKYVPHLRPANAISA